MLRGVRVLNCSGSGSNSGVIAGVDWVRVNHIAPAVANMSLGGGASSALDTAVNNLHNANVTIAVAAGNSNANACNSSPARAANAITVGSTTTTDARSSFSNFGTCLDIFAPGSGILSAWCDFKHCHRDVEWNFNGFTTRRRRGSALQTSESVSFIDNHSQRDRQQRDDQRCGKSRHGFTEPAAVFAVLLIRFAHPNDTDDNSSRLRLLSVSFVLFCGPRLQLLNSDNCEVTHETLAPAKCRVALHPCLARDDGLAWPSRRRPRKRALTHQDYDSWRSIPGLASFA